MFTRTFIVGTNGRINKNFQGCNNCSKKSTHITACLRRYERLINKPYSKPRLPKGARPIIEDAIEAVLAHPETADMTMWVKHEHTVPALVPPVEDGYCGTTACLAGHIGLAAGLPPSDNISVAKVKQLPVLQDLKIFEKDYTWEYSRIHVAVVAAELLHLSEDERDRVFIYTAWPQPFRRRYGRSRSQKGKARAMADRLRHYLDTGE